MNTNVINKKKKIAAGLSIISNVILTSLKIVAGILSGSLSIISEAIHSASDFFASILTFYSVKKSSEPADKDHPYGHGKYEDMAGFIEGFLIILASIYIVFESAKKILISSSKGIEDTTLGIIVMFVAVVLNFLVSHILFKVAKESNSISLYADGQHLRTDVYSSCGVFLGLILIKLTGYTILDSIIAIIVAIFIYNTGFVITKKAVMSLLDFSLPNEDIEKIKNIIYSFSNKVKLKENSIKARQIGPSKDIDIILQFPCETTICDCHKICDEIEAQIQSVFLNSSISIHTEPICYSENCHSENKTEQTNKIN